MDAKEFISLLKDPSLLNGYTMDYLIRQAAEYPFAQSFYPLIAKKAHVVNDGDYESWLSKAAIRSIDRKQLYRFIHQSEVEMPEPEDKQEKGIETKKEKKEDKSEKKGTYAEAKKTKQATIIGEKGTATGKKTSKEKAAESGRVKKTKPQIKQEKEKAPEFSSAPKGKKQTIQPKVEKPSTFRQPSFEGKHTFTDWFKYIKSKPPVVTDDLISPEASYEARIIKESVSQNDDQAPTVTNLIVEPELEKRKELSPEEEQAVSKLAADSIESSSEMITETLAKIYETQKKYDKAIDAYERLILKYPDKKTYFAQKIEKLKSE